MNEFYDKNRALSSFCYSRAMYSHSRHKEERFIVKDRFNLCRETIIRGKNRIKKSQIIEIPILKERLLKSQSLIEQMLNQISNSLFQPIFKFLGDKIKNISNIDKIIVATKDEINDFWFLVQDDNSETEDKICNILVDMLEHYPNVKFDFMILEKGMKGIEDFIPQNGKVIYP